MFVQFCFAFGHFNSFSRLKINNYKRFDSLFHSIQQIFKQKLSLIVTLKFFSPPRWFYFLGTEGRRKKEEKKSFWNQNQIIPCEKNVVKWNNYLNYLNKKRNNYFVVEETNGKRSETKAISISIKTFMDSPMGIITHSSLENRVANKNVMLNSQKDDLKVVKKLFFCDLQWDSCDFYVTYLLFFRAVNVLKNGWKLFNNFMDLAMVQLLAFHFGDS